MDKIHNTAIYHLKKLIGLSREIQTHKDALKLLGVVMDDESTLWRIEEGIQNFDLPLECLGQYIIAETPYGVTLFQNINKEDK